MYQLLKQEIVYRLLINVYMNETISTEISNFTFICRVVLKIQSVFI